MRAMAVPVVVLFLVHDVSSSHRCITS